MSIKAHLLNISLDRFLRNLGDISDKQKHSPGHQSNGGTEPIRLVFEFKAQMLLYFAE